MLSRKRRRHEPPTTHPHNRYSEKPPDFRLLASLYPSFEPFVFTSARSGRPTIDWTDFNATRELTRVLLLHDHGVNWWIPDGQLCPTVPNRSNYIHWIGDLLSADVIPKRSSESDGRVRGFDIGTGANCIYPLLGASLLGWSFVGSDVADVALEWARKNVKNNPHLSELIEIRDANYHSCHANVKSSSEVIVGEGDVEPAVVTEEAVLSNSKSKESCYHGPPILVSVVKDGEEFDFCMCNPPFFVSIGKAGLNPKTSCGGTLEEMVCPGGEQAFITRIIEDSVTLKNSFRWFTSMVGRKANLKHLVSKVREAGASIVKTTEFVQGQTARWGLAWSFLAPNKKSIVSHAPGKGHHSFMLEGLKRQQGAIQVLKAVESFFLAIGASCKSDFLSFCVNITLSYGHIPARVKEGQCSFDENTSYISHNGSHNLQCPSDELCFRVSVFEQIPGTLLVKGSLLHKGSPLSGMFSSVFQDLEEALRKEFIDKPHG